MDETELGRPLSDHEREVLETLLAVDFPGVAELRAQVPSARVAGSRTSGTAPSFDIAVAGNAPRSALTQKMAPIAAMAFDADGEYTGEFILWLADGYLSGLEYAWITDETPETLPDPDSIQVSVKA